jgi:hypothetical protein
MNHKEIISFIFGILMLIATTLIIMSDLNHLRLDLVLVYSLLTFAVLFFTFDFISKSLEPQGFGAIVGALSVLFCFVIVIFVSLIFGSFINQTQNPELDSQILSLLFVSIKNADFILVSGCIIGWACQRYLGKFLSSLTHHSSGTPNGAP